MEPFLVYKFYSREKPSDAWKKLPPLKRILALPTKGQNPTNQVQQPFEITKFQTKHPVVLSLHNFILVTAFYHPNYELWPQFSIIIILYVNTICIRNEKL